MTDLHIGYENVTPFELTETVTGAGRDDELYRVRKVTFGNGKGRSTIVYTTASQPHHRLRHTETPR